MALTAYCKKCGAEVDPGEVCSRCGTKLGKNAAHSVWCVERVPVKDWMGWNAVMRVLLPAGLAVILLVLLGEGLSGGIEAVERSLRSGFLTVVGILLGAVLLLVFLALLLQGKDLTDYAVDSRGIHEIRYLPSPTALKLLTRMLPPSKLKQADTSGQVSVLRLSERHIAWKDIARVQPWPEKCMMLVYSPRWWLRIAVVCTPFSWEDMEYWIREKLGRKRNVDIPANLVVQAPSAARRRKAPEPRLVPEVEEAIGQIRMEELLEEGRTAEGGTGDGA